MQINAFLPTEYVTLHGDFVNALGLPHAAFHLPPLPEGGKAATFAQILLCVSALNGEDNDPHFYIKVHDEAGEPRGGIENLWVWEDSDFSPMKWRVFALRVPYVVTGPGVFTFGVYAGPDDGPGQALSSFQVPVFLDMPPTEVTFR